MENSKITRKNPEGMHGPVGSYTHVTKIPRNSELYVTSGQIGADRNGNIPENMNEQIKNTFDNIQTVLHSEKLSSEHYSLFSHYLNSAIPLLEISKKFR